MAVLPFPGPSAFVARERARRAARVERLDDLADRRDVYRAKNRAYYAEIERLARFWIPEGRRVLEIGCSTGDLLAALRPSRGVGIDLSPRTIELARDKWKGHLNLRFEVADAERLTEDGNGLAAAIGNEPLDWVIMSDVVGHLEDVWAAFRALRGVMGPQTRLLVTSPNFVWEPAFKLAAALGRKMPVPEQNWLGLGDLVNLLGLNQLEPVTSGTAVLLPVDVPLVSSFANRVLARLPGFHALALVQYVVARPVWHLRAAPKKLRCTVVVPCKNEQGNVADIFARTPDLGAGTELLFVDGSSDDGTVEEIQRHLPSRPNTRFLAQGDGKGKGDAVRKGFAAATGDVLFILDADLTVPPEDLPKFLAALAEGEGEFVNGTRLVYPMEGQAMRFLNLLGNKFFSLAFTYILGRPIKDTLCGTKVVTRKAYEAIAAGREYFGDFDPFGDFDLLFGAARAGLKIVEVPVRYRARTYGETKISRFKHGFLLLRMTALAWRKFKTTV